MKGDKVMTPNEIIQMNERHKRDYEKIEAMLEDGNYDFDNLNTEEEPPNDFDAQLDEVRRLLMVIP